MSSHNPHGNTPARDATLDQAPAPKPGAALGHALWNLQKKPAGQTLPMSPAAAETLSDAATLVPDAQTLVMADKAGARVAESAPTMLAQEPGAVASIAQVGEAATLTPESLLSAPPSSLAPSVATSRRSTVLPRLELVNAEPRLIHNQRDRYEQLNQLGEGGMGEVLKVRDNDIGRTVAIKRLKPEMKHPAVLVRFMEEIRTIGRLEHPNIIPIHDVGVDEHGEYYFVMKFFDGETLEAIIEKLAAGDRAYHAAYPFERRMAVFEGILEALNYAHANGIVHRDIKPANIMVGKYGEVMVMDWGVARRVKDEQQGPEPGEVFAQVRPHGEPPQSSSRRNAELFRTRQGALIGTPAYMSPEQARGEPVDERSDIYSLCVLLHELLHLTHYLDDKQTLPELIEAVQSRPVPMGLGCRHPTQTVVPADLAWFIHAGVSKDPAKRYGSAAAMIERLRRRKAGDIPIQCQITFMVRVSNVIGGMVLRNPMLATLGMMVVLLLTIGVVIAMVIT